MKNICFFNHFHNGDIFHGKSFLDEIIKSVNTNFYYAHLNNPNLLLDLDLTHVNLSDIDVGDRTKFLETEDTLYVNTWIGCYFHQGIRYSSDSMDSGCTLKFTYAMYSKIYEEINSVLKTNLKLSEVENYVPFIDYKKFNIKKIDEYVEVDKNKKILFANGPCLSGQCRYHGDLQPVIETLASKYPEITFIVTTPLDTCLENIRSTKDIIQVDGCDLNEIGYLSTFCDIIVGRNSGPFCFSTNKDNVNNPNISFYAFGDNLTDCFLYEIDLECDFVFEFFSDLDVITSSLDNLIIEKFNHEEKN